MTTIFKATGAADFLALVPRLLEYSPVRSLVLVPFAGKRTLGAMRIDLPETDDAREVDQLASTFIGMLCKIDAADGVAPVVYTGARFGEVEGLPHDALVSALLARADLCGLRVVDALCVAADGWGSYLDAQCPPGGRPLDGLPLDDARLADLPAATGHQGSGAGLPAVDLAEKERLARAVAALEVALGAVLAPGASPGPAGGQPDRVDPRALAAADALDDIPLLYETALRWDPAHLDPCDAAAFAWCLNRPVFRDVALVQWCGTVTDGDEALEAQLRWIDEREPTPEHLGERMWGAGARPDPERLTRALALTRRVAAALPREARTGVLATCAWLAWALGRSTHAAAYGTAALDIDPDHGLSRIVLTMVANAHLPEWAYERSAP